MVLQVQQGRNRPILSLPGQPNGIPGFDTGSGGPGTPILGSMQNIAPTAPEPFVWGDGGSQITPEEIARRRAIAQAEGKSDYSPVQNWAQGLGRVVDGLMAGMENRKLDKATKANTDHAAIIMRELMGGKGDATAAAIVDPTLSNDQQAFAKMKWERDHKAPPALPEVAQLAQLQNDPTQPQYIRDAAAAHLKVMNDPMMSATLPGNRGSYSGPVSSYAPTLQAAGLPTVASGQSSPPAAAIADLRADPSGAAEFDQVFGPGASAKYLGGGGGNATGGFPGQR